MESRKIILCVDDDPIISSMLMFQLNKSLDPMTHIIESESDPSAVLDILESCEIGESDKLTMIIDYQMPKMNGAELAIEIKKAYPRSRCIMLSGQSTEAVVEELLSIGVLDHFLCKPWDAEGLLEAIGEKGS